MKVVLGSALAFEIRAWKDGTRWLTQLGMSQESLNHKKHLFPIFFILVCPLFIRMYPKCSFRHPTNRSLFRLKKKERRISSYQRCRCFRVKLSIWMFLHLICQQWIFSTKGVEGHDFEPVNSWVLRWRFPPSRLFSNSQNMESWFTEFSQRRRDQMGKWPWGSVPKVSQSTRWKTGAESPHQGFHGEKLGWFQLMWVNSVDSLPFLSSVALFSGSGDVDPSWHSHIQPTIP